MRKRALVLVLGGLFALGAMNAESCSQQGEKLKTTGVKLEREGKHLEELSNQEERERQCESTPPYHCKYEAGETP